MPASMNGAGTNEEILAEYPVLEREDIEHWFHQASDHCWKGAEIPGRHPIADRLSETHSITVAAPICQQAFQVGV